MARQPGDITYLRALLIIITVGLALAAMASGAWAAGLPLGVAALIVAAPLYRDFV